MFAYVAENIGNFSIYIIVCQLCSVWYTNTICFEKLWNEKLNKQTWKCQHAYYNASVCENSGDGLAGKKIRQEHDEVTAPVTAQN